ncbi:MAG TPA: archease [Nitrososphaeria archaeon]|jgi:SHS2 domain-containing protein|nr:archease [Conexivisphaerales archaeon]PMP95935.1 MAG: archease [Nitrososphaera sp.]HEU16904.1 archease [Nitrososphaeria archaeon]
MRWYRELPHMSDALMEAYGRTMPEVFANAARAMMSIMLDVRRVRGALEERCEVQGYDVENLLYNWLECVLNKLQVDGNAFTRFRIDMDDRGTGLSAIMKGERYDPSRHGMGREVKAVTYHMMSVGRRDGLYYARFLLDL